MEVSAENEKDGQKLGWDTGYNHDLITKHSRFLTSENDDGILESPIPK